MDLLRYTYIHLPNYLARGLCVQDSNSPKTTRQNASRGPKPRYWKVLSAGKTVLANNTCALGYGLLRYSYFHSPKYLARGRALKTLTPRRRLVRMPVRVLSQDIGRVYAQTKQYCQQCTRFEIWDSSGTPTFTYRITWLEAVRRARL